MLNDPQKLIELVLAASTFALVLSLWIGGIMVWSSKRRSRQRKVRRRLGIADTPATQRVLHLWTDGGEVTTTVPTLARNNTLPRKLEYQFAQAGWPLDIAQIIVLVGGVLAMTMAFVMVISGNIMLAAGIAISLVVVFRIILLEKVARREAMFETQLVDALELASRSLRAGHPLLGAFQLVAEEMAAPVNAVFANICAQHGMGADLEEVLRDTGDESASEDMKLFATSVAIQIRTGGNLADLMQRLALVIRDRMRLHRRFRVLTAQTQMSKRVLLALPFFMFILLNVLNAKYMSAFYFTFPGKVMLALSVVLLVLGAWVMHRMVQLKY